jgi:hypothetical protein
MVKARKMSPLQSYLSTHAIESFEDVLDAAEPRPAESGSREEKKNYAERFSDAFAVLISGELRRYLPEVLPNPDGTGNESPARTGKGVKMLDVNYSTPQLGLGLGVSVKTLNFRDPRTKRYTKNPTRLDNELRAEAMDYHERQPFAVLVAIVLVPADACNDGDPKKKTVSWSSFSQIVTVLRHRVGRTAPRNDSQLFEKGFVGLYHYAGKDRGRVAFFDMADPAPQFGAPEKLYGLDGVIRHIMNTYDVRNVVKRPWEAKGEEPVPFAKLVEEDRIPPADDESEEDNP